MMPTYDTEEKFTIKTEMVVKGVRDRENRILLLPSGSVSVGDVAITDDGERLKIVGKMENLAPVRFLKAEYIQEQAT